MLIQLLTPHSIVTKQENFLWAITTDIAKSPTTPRIMMQMSLMREFLLRVSHWNVNHSKHLLIKSSNPNDNQSRHLSMMKNLIIILIHNLSIRKPKLLTSKVLKKLNISKQP